MKNVFGIFSYINDEWTTVPMTSEIDKIPTMSQWCSAQASEKHFTYSYTMGIWCFEDEKDALHFVLKWS